MSIGKFFERNLIIFLLAINGYFLLSISNSLKESAKYHSDIRACAKMKAFLNDKDLSKFYQQEASAITGIEIKFISEYCQKLIKKNLF